MINSRSVQSLYAMLLCARVMYVLYTTSTSKYSTNILQAPEAKFLTLILAYTKVILQLHIYFEKIQFRKKTPSAIVLYIFALNFSASSFPALYVKKTFVITKLCNARNPDIYGVFYKDFFWLYISYNYTMYTSKAADHLASIINNIKE